MRDVGHGLWEVDLESAVSFRRRVWVRGVVEELGIRW